MHRFIAPAKHLGGRSPAGKSLPGICTSTRSQSRGFSLIELMIGIAVVAILLVIAVPSFNSIINSNRLKTTANAMIGSLNTARMAAVQRNANAQFCSNSATTNKTDTLGSACGSTNVGAVIASSASTTLPVAAAPPELSIPSIQIHGTSAAIRFNSLGQGFAAGSTTTPFDSSTAGAVMDICSTAISSNNHIQINMAVGSIITTTTSSGACP